jgi:translation initiation factor 1A
MKKKSKELKPTIRRARLPKRGEQLAVVREMSGGSRMLAMCNDGFMRMVRIGGKFKRRMWCRENDLIIIKPWVVQSEGKCDLVYRYLPAERNWLKRNNKIPEELDIW